MGDAETRSFDRLFREEWPRIYRLVFRLTGERAEAEDIALEVFWRYYDRAPRSGSQEETTGWLYRVATNLGYNALRSRQRRTDYETAAGKQVLPGRSGVDPELELERAETRQRVREILSGMKPKQAKILVLRHSGLSYAEIAAALKIAPGSVGTLLTRAEKVFAARYQVLEGE